MIVDCRASVEALVVCDSHHATRYRGCYPMGTRQSGKELALNSAQLRDTMLEKAGITPALLADALRLAFQASITDLTSSDASARNAARKDIYRLTGVDNSAIDSGQSTQVIIPVPAWGKVSIESSQPTIIEASEATSDPESAA